jgi:hypothetical protein
MSGDDQNFAFYRTVIIVYTCCSNNQTMRIAHVEHLYGNTILRVNIPYEA